MKRDRIASAARLFRDFSGHQAQAVVTISEPDHDTQLLVGECEGILYNTVRDGKPERYIHEFSESARPLLTAAHDGSRLYLLDGAYTFTDAGITDRKGRKMPNIALVNPRRRSRKTRSAAQKAATRKMIAANRSRRSGGHHTARRKGRGKMPAALAHYWASHGRKTNPSRRRRSSYRRNPIGFDLQGFMSKEVGPAMIGAAGALGVDMLIGMMPTIVPVQFQTGLMRKVAQLAGVLGMGALAGAVVGKRAAESITAGGVTVVLYDMVKGFLVTSFPTLPLSPTATVVVPTTTTAAAATPAATGTAGIGWTSPAMQMPGPMGEYMSEYLSHQGAGMGAIVRAY